MKREPPTDDERRKAWAEGRSPTSDPTGTLQLLIESWYSAPIRKQWRDRKENPLENQIRSILVGFLVAAAFERERRLEREAEHRRRLIAEQKMAALEERRRKEREQFDALIREANAWEQAERIRRYVDAQLAATGGADGNPIKDDVWIAWARNVAERIDPTSRGAVNER